MVLLIHTHIVLMDFWSGLGISWDILWNILESHVWKKMQLRKVFFWLYAFWLPFLAEGICPGMTSTLDDLRLMKHPFAREVWIIFSYIISYIFSYIMTYIYIFIIHTYMGIHMYTYCAYIYPIAACDIPWDPTFFMGRMAEPTRFEYLWGICWERALTASTKTGRSWERCCDFWSSCRERERKLLNYILIYFIYKPFTFHKWMPPKSSIHNDLPVSGARENFVENSTLPNKQSWVVTLENPSVNVGFPRFGWRDN